MISDESTSSPVSASTFRYLIRLPHAGPRHTPYKRATPHMCGAYHFPRTGVSHLSLCVANLFGSENDRLLRSPYRSVRSRHWIKSKTRAAPAVKREAEEDWGRERWR